MNLRGYIISSSALVLTRFKEICRRNNLPIEFKLVQLCDLTGLQRTDKCFLLVDYRMLVKINLDIQFLDGCRWVLITEEEKIHVEVLKFPPFFTLQLNQTNSGLINDFKKILQLSNEANSLTKLSNQISIYDLNNRKLTINPDQVMYAQADGDYSILYFEKENNVSAQEKVLVAKSLKQLEQELLNFGFFRIHRSYLANINMAKELKINGSLLRFKDGLDLPIARRRKKQVKELMSK